MPQLFHAWFYLFALGFDAAYTFRIKDFNVSKDFNDTRLEQLDAGPLYQTAFDASEKATGLLTELLERLRQAQKPVIYFLVTP